MASNIEEENFTFTNTRGQKLRRWSLPDVELPRAICIMVHGIGGHVASYCSIAEVFWEKHTISMCGYDQVGHGMSEGERVDIKDFQHYVDDLIQFVDIIKSEHAGLSIFAIGHSMGGLVLCHALLHKPDLVDGAVMYAAFIYMSPGLYTRLMSTLAWLLSFVSPSLPVGDTKNTNLTRNEEEVELLEKYQRYFSIVLGGVIREIPKLEKRKTDPLRHQGGIKIRCIHHLLTAITELGPRISEMIVPMLIAQGTDDGVCHIDGSIMLYDRISAADKTLKIYDKCYHILHVEPDGQGEQFINDMCEWMNSRIKS